MASPLRPDKLGLSCGFRSDEGRRCWHGAWGGKPCWDPGSPVWAPGRRVGHLDLVSGVASLTCWGYLTLLDGGVWVACLTCWGISQPYPAMKMLLLKPCMRSLMTLWLGRRVFLVAQVGVSACLPGTSGCHPSLVVRVFSLPTDPTCAPGSQRQPCKVVGWPLEPCEPSASIYTAGARPLPSQP